MKEKEAVFMTIGKSIYHLRTESNLSQGQFAAIFGVS